MNQCSFAYLAFCQCQRAREYNRSDVLIPWWQSNAPSSKIILLVWKVPFCISTSPGLTWPEHILKAAPLLVLAAAYWVLNLIFKFFKSMKNGRKEREWAFFLWNVCVPRLSTVCSALTVLGSLSLLKFFSLDVDPYIRMTCMVPLKETRLT